MPGETAPALPSGEWAAAPLTPDGAALQHAPWRSRLALSRTLAAVEHFLARSRFDRAPWLAVAYGVGIAAWFALRRQWEWIALLAGAAALLCGTLGVLRGDGRYPYLRHAIAGIALATAAGCATIWTKSALTGTPGLARPMSGTVTGLVLAREDQPAEARARLVLAMRDPADAAHVLKVRLNVPRERDDQGAVPGALITVPARLMPPAPPMLPGAYDFARAAWFQGLAGTGTAFGKVAVVSRVEEAGSLPAMRQGLSRHIHTAVPGSPGGIAAAFASGDRGGIGAGDEDAMRDAGLTHLLSVSGLHVSAVIGGVYVLVLRLLALWPWLTLRVRLPLLAAGAGAGAGVFYTVLTGAEVPTVRSVAGSLLVLAAVALGRQPLSLRLLAVAGFAVMLVWPEAVAGPSFQLSFAAVLAIVAVHQSGWMRALAARREEPWWQGIGRHLAVVLITGIVIELALLPIGLYHFHRAGVYGALANVIAIPLTTFATMPLIALALVLDLIGAGAPAWWAVGKSLELLLAIAHFVASQPGAVSAFPAMGGWAYALFLAGGLWLALWSTRIRLAGLVPIAVGAAWLALLAPPDVLVSGDGRHVAFTGLVPGKLLMLRDTRSAFARDRLTEIAGMDGDIEPLDAWPGARCNDDFCALTVRRGGRDWRFLLGRGTQLVPLSQLSAACAAADVVVADRRLPRSCRPRVLKADRAMLRRTGGISMDLQTGEIATVADSQGEHGWWRAPEAGSAYSGSRRADQASRSKYDRVDGIAPAVLSGTPHHR